ncbi:MAG: PQQ-binding-like beta-propeller repeat protein [Candidatus Hinthialibacter antarcticus]|nr:PQQ-binding-like beta-propeller repeat protein [Candidatus Hinthialibacter antarcticus]
MKRLFLSLVALTTLLSTSTFAADWTQYLGPNRDATSPETGLLKEWPEGGPEVLWTLPLGIGYGAPAVSEGKAYLLDRQPNKDIFLCIDMASGKLDWSFEYDAPGRFSHGGSRCTPAIADGLAYTIGQQGHLYCFDLKTKKPVWNKMLRDGFGEGESLNWGFGQNPLVYKGMLIVAPMTKQTEVVALNPKTGELIWASEPFTGRAGYVSPAVYSIGGTDHIVMISATVIDRRNRSAEIQPQNQGAVAGLDPTNGKTLWKYNGWGCMIPIPNMVAIGDGRFFITGGYEAGSAMIRVTKDGGDYKVEELFKTKAYNAHCHPPLLYKGHLYGPCTTNEQRDGLICMDLDGNVKWKTERDPIFDKGGLILADNMIFISDGKDGVLYLVDPSPDAFKPLAKAKLLEPGENWAPLALVDGKLLVRDQTQIKCLKVR